MFGIGKNKSKHNELEGILDKTYMYMSNNYKDAARDSYIYLKSRFDELKRRDQLKPAQIEHYENIIGELKVKLEKFSHKQM